MEFDDFMPPKNVLNFIGWSDAKYCHSQYTIFPQPFDPERILPIAPLIEIIKSYFNNFTERKTSCVGPFPKFYNLEEFIWEDLGMYSA